MSSRRFKFTEPKITLHCAQWVFDAPTASQLRCFEKGAIAYDQNGVLVGFDKASTLKKKYKNAIVIDHGPFAVITPGFVDCHVHAPQFEMLAAAGYSLLEWLNHHTFPTEARYANPQYASRRWNEFCQGLLRCGTTFAAMYGTSHTQATFKLLQAAEKAGLRAHVGKVLMDRNAPANLLQSADEALQDLEILNTKWKSNARVKVSLAVRFAPTSTPYLLKRAGEFAREHPEILIQTHLAETPEEVRWVSELFPKARHYADVYDKAGLINNKSVLGHCIYLADAEIAVLGERKSHLVHCPSSNFFLGSGLFQYEKLAHKHNLSVAMGSDVGAGWDLSLQSTARCCYEAQALQKYFMKAGELLYLVTRAGAIALGHNEDLGAFSPEFKADFVVHDLRGRSLVLSRAQRSESHEELLSALLFLGGEVTIKATYVNGICVYKKSKTII